MGEHLWCYRAHCMQARIINDAAINGAAFATDRFLQRNGVLVSLPLPVLLIGSHRCGMPAWSEHLKARRYTQKTPHRPEEPMRGFSYVL